MERTIVVWLVIPIILEIEVVWYSIYYTLQNSRWRYALYEPWLKLIKPKEAVVEPVTKTTVGS